MKLGLAFDIARRAFVLAMLAFFPGAVLLWLATTAYKPSSEIFSIPPRFAFTPTLDQFRNAFRIFDIGSLVESSLLIAGGSTLLSLLLGVPRAIRSPARNIGWRCRSPISSWPSAWFPRSPR